MTTRETKPPDWDERYSRAGYWAGKEPSAFLVETLPFLPKGRVLDLACGEGRNAVFLAGRGREVWGVDRSRPGLEKAAALAAEHSVRVRWSQDWPAQPLRPRQGTAAHRPVGAELVLMFRDLEGCQLPQATFDVIVNLNYLERSLFGPIVRALRPGGVLVFETYTREHLNIPTEGLSGAALGPRNPEHLLREGELRQAFSGLEVLFYREYAAGRARASLLARKPDV